MSGEAQMEERLDEPLRDVLERMQRRILTDSKYLGIPTWRSPIDFWVCQEIMAEVRPDWIVEIGNYCGGGALALAHLCDALGHGRVLGVDREHGNLDPRVLEHPRTEFIDGDAVESAPRVRDRVPSGASVLVIEDSLHTFENTLGVLRAYSPLVRPGGYFIVEDGICGHGVDTGPSPGPYEAVEAFLKESRDFELDRGRESFGITWNPKGYLRRTR